MIVVDVVVIGVIGVDVVCSLLLLLLLRFVQNCTSVGEVLVLTKNSHN